MGNIFAVIRESFPSKSKWGPDEIPDLSGKVILVTGANTGIGKETAKHLLTHNAKVYIACRNQQKAEDAIRDLKSITGKEAFFLQLDLGDLPSVKVSAQEFLSKENRLDVLINNGGVMLPPIDQVTAQGYDLQFGTNVLGHFYLTKLLLPLLVESAKTAPDGHVRVVNVSSSGHQFVGSLKWDTFRDGPARKKYGQENLYAQSKFGNAVFANELARRYGDQGIVSTSLNPGNIKSELQRHQGLQATIIMSLIAAAPTPFLSVQVRAERWLGVFLCDTPGDLCIVIRINSMLFPIEYGALSSLYAAAAPEAASLNGKYFVPWATLGQPRRDVFDRVAAKKLWEWLEEQVVELK